MNAKKLTALFLVFAMAIGVMTGCGTSGSSSSASNEETEAANDIQTTSDSNEATNDSTAEDAASNADTDTEAVAEETENTSESTSAESGKTLVVYYSASGNTKGVAETIAQITGGDLFEIVPAEIYTSDDLNWSNSDSRVSREHDDESLRDVELVSTTVENWDSYDTVYIGYPIWWGIAAWPVDGFVKANDFTGKTVIPFCTAASSGIGDSGNLLRDMAGTGDWKDGERFHGGASESDVRSWIESLGL